VTKIEYIKTLYSGTQKAPLSERTAEIKLLYKRTLRARHTMIECVASLNRTQDVVRNFCLGKALKK